MCAFPSQRKLEVPLLWAVLVWGGEIEVSDDLKPVAKELGELFKLNSDDYARLRKDGRRAWPNHLEYVRWKLVNNGELTGDCKGLWSLTEKGRERAVSWIRRGLKNLSRRNEFDVENMEQNGRMPPPRRPDPDDVRLLRMTERLLAIEFGPSRG